MAHSLQDQLLRAGAASKQQSQKASTERRKHNKQKKKKGSASQLSESSKRSQQQQQEKAARDRELNRQRQDAADQKAISAQIQQLIELNRLPREDSETVYNFVDGTLVRKILVDPAMLNQLSRGVLAIAKYKNSYEVVPLVVAEKIRERDSSIIITSNQEESIDNADVADDPYADYQVPDDLLW
jgi:uncharacterized protein YaiL (DUF2058 family)